MATHARQIEKLPGRFAELVRLMPPRAIDDEIQHQNMIEMIDRLMASGKMAKGQQAYLETLVQLVEVYEQRHHSIEVNDLSGLDALRHLMAEAQMNASDLARLLGSHVSMGSKILKGERSLTVDHLRTLAARFQVDPHLFMD